MADFNLLEFAEMQFIIFIVSWHIIGLLLRFFKMFFLQLYHAPLSPSRDMSVGQREEAQIRV